MDDRNVQFPTRYRMIKVPGTDDIFDMIPAPGTVYNEGTLINKANLLTDAVTNLIGLTGDVVPNDMMRVLATAGDLHVWRRTVETSEKIPAKYSLGPTQWKTPLTYPKTPTTQATFHYGKSISIDDNGGITINGEQTVRLNSDDSSVSKANNLKGSFFYRDSSTTIGADNGFETGPGNVYFIPSDAIISREPDSYLGGVLYTSKYQKVYTTPAVPPGTYIDYPVSVNPNAYQAGSDAKPAGYTLGAKQQALVKSLSGSSTTTISYSNSVSVSDDGTVTLVDYQIGDFKAGTSNVSRWNALKGKFYGVGTSVANYYVPDNAVFSAQSNGDIYVDKRQTVTGYPAIPASTTIEYLGKLGDKSRMQVVSYVGTGTGGSGNKTVVSFYFAPSIIFIFGYAESNNVDFGVFVNGFSVSPAFLLDANVNSLYSRTNNFTLDSGELSLYNIGEARSQFNAKGKKYTAIGFA